MTKSEQLLQDFRDKLNDQAHVQETSDGIPYGYFTEAQLKFMQTLKTTKEIFPLPLWEGQEEYPLPFTFVEMAKISYNDPDLNPFIQLPKTTTSNVRVMKVTAGTMPKLTAGFYWFRRTQQCGRTIIKNGDVMLAEVWMRPPKGYKITSKFQPVIEEDFWPDLIDWALSYYQSYEKVKGKVVPMNGKLKSQQQVLMAVKEKRDAMYNLNGVQVYDFNFIRM